MNVVWIDPKKTSKRTGIHRKIESFRAFLGGADWISSTLFTHIAVAQRPGNPIPLRCSLQNRPKERGGYPRKGYLGLTHTQINPPNGSNVGIHYLPGLSANHHLRCANPPFKSETPREPDMIWANNQCQHPKSVPTRSFRSPFGKLDL